MESTNIQGHIEYHQRELTRLQDLLRLTKQSEYVAGKLGSMMDQTAAAVATNTAAAKTAHLQAGNAAHSGAIADRRKAGDTDLRKIALAHAVVKYGGSMAVEAAGLYLAFLKGDKPAYVEQAQFSSKLPEFGNNQLYRDQNGLPG